MTDVRLLREKNRKQMCVCRQLVQSRISDSRHGQVGLGFMKVADFTAHVLVTSKAREVNCRDDLLIENWLLKVSYTLR